MAQDFSFTLKDGERITKVLIRHGDIADAIGFQTTDAFGRAENNKGPIWFSATPSPTATITELPLRPDEEITRIEGRYGKYQGKHVIAKMKIYTNYFPGGYGPFGPGTYTKYTMPLCVPTVADDDGTIIGFYGSCNTYLSLLGVYKKHGLDSRAD